MFLLIVHLYFQNTADYFLNTLLLSLIWVHVCVCVCLHICVFLCVVRMCYVVSVCVYVCISVCSYRPGGFSRVGRAMTQQKIWPSIPRGTFYVGLLLFWCLIGSGPLLEESCFSGSDGGIICLSCTRKISTTPISMVVTAVQS